MDEETSVSFKENVDDGEIITLLCAHCRSKNKHTIILSSRQDIEFEGMFFITTFYIARCNGCDEQKFATLDVSSEDIDYVEDPKTGKYDTIYLKTVKQYPLVNINYAEPHYYSSMQPELREAYKETYMALSSDAKKLASIGMRSIIETICALNDIVDEEAYYLPEKIKLLMQKGVISSTMRDVLLNIKEFGDKGAHTLRMPKPEELKVAWEAINILIASIYGTQDSKNNTTMLAGFRKPKHRTEQVNE